jgi:hypothetical protein
LGGNVGGRNFPTERVKVFTVSIRFRVENLGCFLGHFDVVLLKLPTKLIFLALVPPRHSIDPVVHLGIDVLVWIAFWSIILLLSAHRLVDLQRILHRQNEFEEAVLVGELREVRGVEDLLLHEVCFFDLLVLFLDVRRGLVNLNDRRNVLDLRNHLHFLLHRSLDLLLALFCFV